MFHGRPDAVHGILRLHLVVTKKKILFVFSLFFVPLPFLLFCRTICRLSLRSVLSETKKMRGRKKKRTRIEDKTRRARAGTRACHTTHHQNGTTYFETSRTGLALSPMSSPHISNMGCGAYKKKEIRHQRHSRLMPGNLHFPQDPSGLSILCRATRLFCHVSYHADMNYAVQSNLAAQYSSLSVEEHTRTRREASKLKQAQTPGRDADTSFAGFQLDSLTCIPHVLTKSIGLFRSPIPRACLDEKSDTRVGNASWNWSCL